MEQNYFQILTFAHILLTKSATGYEYYRRRMLLVHSWANCLRDGERSEERKHL